MKSRYKRKAWYLDDGILLEGNVDKRGFHPNQGVGCGFGTQEINKKMIGVEIFFDLDEALRVCGKLEVVTGEDRANLNEEELEL